jgi:hypothetical protein
MASYLVFDAITFLPQDALACRGSWRDTSDGIPKAASQRQQCMPFVVEQVGCRLAVCLEESTSWKEELIR